MAELSLCGFLIGQGEGYRFVRLGSVNYGYVDTNGILIGVLIGQVAYLQNHKLSSMDNTLSNDRLLPSFVTLRKSVEIRVRVGVRLGLFA